MRHNAQEVGRLGRPVKVLGIAASVAGILLLGGWMPGSDGMALGPRIGVGAFLLMIGFLMLSIPFVQFFLRRTTKAEDYQGTCPVGESCPACGAFNYKPRPDCRSCGGPVNRAEAPSQA